MSMIRIDIFTVEKCAEKYVRSSLYKVWGKMIQIFLAHGRK